MKRLSSVPQNVLEHGDYQYTTLDLADPDKAYGCSYGGTGVSHRTYIQMPQGWELAPYEDGLVEVLTSQLWGGAHNIILANGNSYSTGRGIGAVRGQLAAEDVLQSIKVGSLTEFKPKKEAGDARIIIRTRVSTTASAATESQTHAEAIVSQLWKKRRFTDFTVVCKGREMACYRAVLAEASPVFEAALAGSMREASERRLEVQDAEPDVVEGMLFFLYNGTLDERAREAAHLAKLLTLGDRYGMRSLVQLSATPLIEKLTPDNVVSVTRALRSIKEHPEVAPLWTALQARLREDSALLGAVLSDV